MVERIKAQTNSLLSEEAAFLMSRGLFSAANFSLELSDPINEKIKTSIFTKFVESILINEKYGKEDGVSIKLFDINKSLSKLDILNQGTIVKLIANTNIPKASADPNNQDLNGMRRIFGPYVVAAVNYISDDRMSLELLCQSFGFNMSIEKLNRVFDNISLIDLVKRIAEDNLLIPEIPRTNNLGEGISKSIESKNSFHQNRETDWVFLSKVAKKFGFYIQVKGNNLKLVQQKTEFTKKVEESEIIVLNYRALDPTESFIGRAGLSTSLNSKDIDMATVATDTGETTPVKGVGFNITPRGEGLKTFKPDEKGKLKVVKESPQGFVKPKIKGPKGRVKKGKESKAVTNKEIIPAVQYMLLNGQRILIFEHIEDREARLNEVFNGLLDNQFKATLNLKLPFGVLDLTPTRKMRIKGIGGKFNTNENNIWFVSQVTHNLNSSGFSQTVICNSNLEEQGDDHSTGDNDANQQGEAKRSNNPIYKVPARGLGTKFIPGN